MLAPVCCRHGSKSQIQNGALRVEKRFHALSRNILYGLRWGTRSARLPGTRPIGHLPVGPFCELALEVEIVLESLARRGRRIPGSSWLTHTIRGRRDTLREHIQKFLLHLGKRLHTLSGQFRHLRKWIWHGLALSRRFHHRIRLLPGEFEQPFLRFAKCRRQESHVRRSTLPPVPHHPSV